MKKLYVLAALMMVTTAAHAGNSISFEIDGHKIHIEAAKNCDSPSCIKVSAPGLSGSGFNLKGFKSFTGDDDVADNDAPVSNPAPPPANRRPSSTWSSRASSKRSTKGTRRLCSPSSRACWPFFDLA